MAYSLNFVANFGPFNSGKTLNGKLLDTAGVQVGATITTGFHEVDDGVYEYMHTALPDNHRGLFLMFDTVDTTLAVGIAINPEEAERTDDILEYLQSLNLTGGSTSQPATTTGTDVGTYIVEPADFRMVTPAELVAEVRELVVEPALKQSMAERAVKSVITEEDHRSTVLITYETTLSNDDCDYPAPCSGARVVAVEVQDDGCTDTSTDACYIPVWFKQERNRIHLAYGVDANAKITMTFGNRYTPDQHTIALAAETDTAGLWQLYIEGQPDIYGSGIIRICGDPWVYAYKCGVAFSSSLVDSEDSIDSSTGYADIGKPMPDGYHTVLYAQRIANCGRLAESTIAEQIAGAVVEWPLIYRNGTHKEYLVALAIAKAYTYLINSSRSDRDVTRFATLQKHWQDEAGRLLLKLPKLQAAQAKRQRAYDSFRSSFALRARRSSADDGRFARIRGLW